MLEEVQKLILFFIPENLSIFLDGMIDKISIGDSKNHLICHYGKPEDPNSWVRMVS